MSATRPVALVTGATSGIGRALAGALSERGYSLALVGRSANTLAELNQSLPNATVNRCYPLDLASEEAVRGLAQQLEQDFSGIAVLAHCAGQYSRGGVGSGSLQDFDQLFRLNVRAPFLLTQLCLPLLRSCQGQVVFLNSSVAAMPARAEEALYTSGKYALRAIADSLRSEVNASGVRVLTVFPGRTATPMQELIHRLDGSDYRADVLLQPSDVALAILGALELPRSAELTELHLRPMRKA